MHIKNVGRLVAGTFISLLVVNLGMTPYHFNKPVLLSILLCILLAEMAIYIPWEKLLGEDADMNQFVLFLCHLFFLAVGILIFVVFATEIAYFKGRLVEIFAISAFGVAFVYFKMKFLFSCLDTKTKEVE